MNIRINMQYCTMVAQENELDKRVEREREIKVKKYGIGINNLSFMY